MNSKNKGNQFERKIANLLSKRFENYTGIKKSFLRNPDSGSYFGGTNQHRMATHNTEFAVLGDMICPRNFIFNIECKHYKTQPQFSHIMQQSIKDWDDWIAKSRQDGKNSQKQMMIIIKYNNVSEVVLIDEKPLDLFYVPYKDCFVVYLDEFLKKPDCDFFK